MSSTRLIRPSFFSNASGNTTTVTGGKISEDAAEVCCEQIPARSLFQHDGTRPHIVSFVRDFLCIEFPKRWIGRKCPLEWIPRCPGRTPCEFVVRAILKTRCLQLNPCDLSKLEESICTDCSKVGEMMQQIIREACNRGLRPRPATEACDRSLRPRLAEVSSEGVES